MKLQKTKSSLKYIAILALALPYMAHAQSATSSSWEYSNWRRDSVLESQIQRLPSQSEAEILVPVLFGLPLSSITANFGDARGGGTRTHEGLDMMAKKGTPIISPTDAVIINTGNGASSGLFISTMNPGGETFVYMHLDSIPTHITSGTYVLRGEVIGFVGNTGNASGGGDHLHFEIRKNGATDPYLRIKKELSLAEKMNSMTKYLERTSDSNLAATLIQNYYSVFASAKAQGIYLHPLLQNVSPYGTVVVTPSPVVSTPTVNNISELQKYLIAQNSGQASALLATYGATGYFGTVTKNALAEFQARVGISPASGNYGPITRAYIAAHPTGAATTTPVVTSNGFTRTLALGDTHTQVLLLQKHLNSTGHLIATSGSGAPGKETSYFGSLTQKALLSYQKNKGLSQTGIVDSQTLTHLQSLAK